MSSNPHFQPNLSVVLPLDTGSHSFLILCAAMVFLMTPGLALFYGGLATRRNQIYALWIALICLALVLVQWILFGYSFAFHYGTSGWGTFLWGALRDNAIYNHNPWYTPAFPLLVHFAFHGMFAVLAAAILSITVVGRVRLFPYLLFLFIWTSIIYDGLAHWFWSRDGWLRTLGAVDWAGGAVVFMSAGFSALALALFLHGKHRYYNKAPLAGADGVHGHEQLRNDGTVARGPGVQAGPVVQGPGVGNNAGVPVVAGTRGANQEPLMQRLPYWQAVCYYDVIAEAESRPRSSVPRVLIGTALLWFGFCAFNSGVGFAADGVAAMALVNTNVCAAMVVLIWVICELIMGIPLTLHNACVSAVYGLVLISAGAGYVAPYYALIIGVWGGVMGFISIRLFREAARRWDLVNVYEIFPVFGLGGMWGMLLVGLFADHKYNPFGPDGSFFLHAHMFAYQLAAVCTTIVYAFVGSFLLVFLINLIVTFEIEPQVLHESMENIESEYPELDTISLLTFGQDAEQLTLQHKLFGGKYAKDAFANVSLVNRILALESRFRHMDQQQQQQQAAVRPGSPGPVVVVQTARPGSPGYNQTGLNVQTVNTVTQQPGAVHTANIPAGGDVQMTPFEQQQQPQPYQSSPFMG